MMAPTAKDETSGQESEGNEASRCAGPEERLRQLINGRVQHADGDACTCEECHAEDLRIERINRAAERILGEEIAACQRAVAAARWFDLRSN